MNEWTKTYEQNMLVGSGGFLDPGTQMPQTPANPALCTMPSNYYDPWNHQTYYPNVNGTNNVTGTITDNDGNAIENGIVMGHSWLWTDNSDPSDIKYGHYPHYTFTHSDGTFTLRPYNFLDPTNDPNQNYLVHIHGSAIGSEEFDDGGWKDIPLANSVYNEQLKRINFGYDGNANNIYVHATETHNLRGWNSLTVSDALFENGGTSEITAREEVNVNTEFHAELGSEVHILNVDFDECPSFDAMRAANSSTAISSENTEAEAKKEIQLSFINKFDIVVYPNPSHESFTVTIFGFINRVFLTLKDIDGRTVKRINTSEKQIRFNNDGISKGIYFLSISDNQNIVTKKIIVN